MVHELPVLRELTLLSGCSLAVILLFRRLRLPPIVGFLVTGALLGPGGLALVRDPHTVATLAEIGVVLLLFTVGLEFSVADLRRLGPRAAVAGTAQVGLTVAFAAAVAAGLAGVSAPRALFLGCLLAPSSTALVLRLVTDRGELSSPHGRLLTGALLVQDLAVVPMAMLVPTLAAWEAGGALPVPGGAAGAGAVAARLVRALLLIATVGIAFGAARRVLPWVLGRASRGRSRETFLAALVLVVLGSAFLSEQAGLSLSLGAFLAGLVLAESELRAQIVAVIVPFRDIFASVFFLSIGMLLSPAAVAAAPGLVVALLLAMTLGKLAVAAGAARAAGAPMRTSLATGIGLAHVGEFSFVLVQAAAATALLPPAWNGAFVAAAVLSLVVAPGLLERAPAWALAAARGVRGLRGAAVDGEANGNGAPRRDARAHHVIIAGFGVNGQNLARVLRKTHIAHVVVDLAPEAVAQCAAEGSEALLGDVTQPEILARAGIAGARVIVLALSDPLASRHAARLARQANRHVFVLARTHSVGELDALHAAGANLVIPEEFETSIEIFSAVLREYHVPNNIIDAQVLLLRQERYSILRGQKLSREVEDQLRVILVQGTTEAVVLLSHSPAVGRTLEALGLVAPAEEPGAANMTAEGDVLTGAEPLQSAAAVPTAVRARAPASGVRLIAVVRGGEAMTSLDPQLELRVGDTLVVTGGHAAIDRVMEQLAPAPPAAAEAAGTVPEAH